MESRMESQQDKFQEECGVFGIAGHDDAATIVTLGLHALQHRGQEAAGIVASDGKKFNAERHYGLIGDTFTKPSVIQRLPGNYAVGHTRYTTAGDSGINNIQPFFANFANGTGTGGFALAHNGNLTNANRLRTKLQHKGAIFQSTSDTETIMHLVAMSKKQDTQKVIDALNQVEGAFSIIALWGKKMIGCRDRLGLRPLVLGDLDGTPILASETCALDIIGAKFVRDVEAGEMVVVENKKVKSVFPFKKTQQRFCIFEYVYFSRPDSLCQGNSVYETRKNIGIELAKESPVDADIVVPVPDSGNPAAIGFAEESKIPFELGIIRNHYVGRTFIAPTDNIRHMGVRLKHNANRQLLKGRNVVLVDDSIVRGTTSKKIVDMVREAGAKKVHMRIASPPTLHGCYYGVDTPDKDKLIASIMSKKEMEGFIGVDSLKFLSIDGLYRAVGKNKRNNKKPQYCDACFTGDYPTQLKDMEDAKVAV